MKQILKENINILRAKQASLVAQMVKHLPAMQETWVQSPGWEYPLEKEMATYQSILAWRIPCTEESGRLHPRGHKEWDTTEQLSRTFGLNSGN